MVEAGSDWSENGDLGMIDREIVYEGIFLFFLFSMTVKVKTAELESLFIMRGLAIKTTDLSNDQFDFYQMAKFNGWLNPFSSSFS